MRKPFILLPILAILVIIELGLTYYVGFESEKAYNRTIELINRTPNIQARNISYQRGFFRSSAITEVRQGSETFVLENKILHGPIIIDTHFSPYIRFGLGLMRSQISHAPVSTPVPQESLTKAPIDAELLFSYFGGAILKTSSPDFTYQDQYTRVEGKSWSGKGSINSKFDSFNFEYLFPEMTIANASTPNFGTKLKNAKVSFLFEKGDSTADEFQVNYKIEDTSTLDNSAQVSNFNATAEFTIYPEFFDSSFNLSFDKLRIQNGSIGPAVLNLSVGNLDKKIFTWFLQKGYQNTTAENQEQMFTQALQRGISLAINPFEIAIPEGIISLEAQGKIGNKTLTAPLTGDKLLATLQGDLTLSVPKVLFDGFLNGYIKASVEKDPKFKDLSDAEKMAKFKTERDQFINNLKHDEILTESDQVSVFTLNSSKQYNIFKQQPQVPVPQASQAPESSKPIKSIKH